MSIVTKPIVLDETGKEIVDALVGIKNAISSGAPAGDPVRITVVTPPTKTHYAMSDTLDMSGITVSAIFSNNYMFDVTEQCTFSPASGSSFSEWGVVPITISWTWHNTGQTFTTTQEVEVEPQIVSFSDGTDDEIETMLEAHYQDIIDVSDYWSVGDTRVMHINKSVVPDFDPDRLNWPGFGEGDITIAIVTMNHTTLETPINGHDKSAITVQTRELLAQGMLFEFPVDGSSEKDMTFTKWADLWMRKILQYMVWPAFPEGTFKSLIKPSRHNRLVSNGVDPTTANTQDGSNTDRTIETVVDTLFLPSYTEVFGNVVDSSYLGGGTPNNDEGSQFEYYTVAANRIKYINTAQATPSATAKDWWLGSPDSSYYTSGYSWRAVRASGESHAWPGTISACCAPAWAM